MNNVTKIIALISATLLAEPTLSATTIDYVYDDLNRVESVVHSDGPQLSYTYDEVGNITVLTTSNPDTDGDGLLDVDEINIYFTSPVLTDTDLDGLSDGDEVNTYNTDPTNPDTDGDSLPDAVEINIYFTNPTVADTDLDGLSDGDEVNIHGTDPTLADTDGDGVNDGDEIIAGTDPLDPASFPIIADGDLNGDGQVNAVDVILGIQIINGEITPTAEQLRRGDVAPLIGGVPAPNGVFNVGDLLLIQRKAVGLVDF